jgi:DNA-binding HxlR family transcriptional regulator
MNGIIMNEERYCKIIDLICEYKKIGRDDLFKILKDKECKYLLLLLLEKHKCTDFQRLSMDLNKISSQNIKSSLKKAEEKFFINRDFRELYFELEEMIEKII